MPNATRSGRTTTVPEREPTLQVPGMALPNGKIKPLTYVGDLIKLITLEAMKRRKEDADEV